MAMAEHGPQKLDGSMARGFSLWRHWHSGWLAVVIVGESPPQPESTEVTPFARQEAACSVFAERLGLASIN